MGGMWLLYQWGVAQDHIIEISLAFFMNCPRCSRCAQRTAPHVAMGGRGSCHHRRACDRDRVQQVPLAKLAPLNAVWSVTIEMAYLVVPALAYLISCEVQGTGALGHVTATQDVLLVLCGIVTVFPLLMFSYSARLIPLSLLGIIQYFCPILNFIIGTAIYHEPFSTSKLIGFILVWLALAMYAVEGLLFKKRPATTAGTATPTDSGVTPSGDFHLVDHAIDVKDP
ncbi:hypothetical protein AC1031_003223 [Aphanomyces cochlioides]|nr:hypothetical protein AC1031_003223 [Aphanomyces cochlioides]